MGIWIAAIYFIGNGNYVCYPPQVLKEYGPENTSSIYGFMFTSSIVSSIILIIYTQNLFDLIGYSWTFAIIGLLCVLSAVISFFYNDSVTSEKLRRQLELKKNARTLQS